MATKKLKTSKKDTQAVSELNPDIEALKDVDVDDSVIEANLEIVDPEIEEVEEEEEEEEEEDASQGEGDKPLDELESEELEMLTEDEQLETIHVDEQAEARAIRREALALEADADAKQDDEFVCQSCFLVKRTSQLANKSKKICSDCAA